MLGYKKLLTATILAALAMAVPASLVRADDATTQHAPFGKKGKKHHHPRKHKRGGRGHSKHHKPTTTTV